MRRFPGKNCFIYLFLVRLECEESEGMLHVLHDIHILIEILRIMFKENGLNLISWWILKSFSHGRNFFSLGYRLFNDRDFGYQFRDKT